MSERISTRAIHAGLSPDPTTGAILTPIYQSTTFVQPAVGVDKGFTYSRTANPTVAALERNLAGLEGAEQAVCYATGMAAITGLCLSLLRAGDHVVCTSVVYGGTVRLLRDVLAKFGVEATYVDPEDLPTSIPEGTRLVFVETPANPTMKLCDIEAAAEAAHAAGALLAVDNTFLTPALQRPLDLGADISVYSTTKYIEGHNSTVGGALLARDPELVEQFRFVQNAVGFGQAPFEAWLTLRGIKTLPLRMKQHSDNALAIARYLERHPQVRNVSYPGLESFPQFKLARRQQSGGGGMIAFEVAGGVEAGKKLLEEVKVCALAESLGAVETLLTHPASMTHATIPAEQRRALGVTDGLIRLSVGLEDAEDLIEDLNQALEKAHA